jgi:hypothetical protein
VDQVPVIVADAVAVAAVEAGRRCFIFGTTADVWPRSVAEDRLRRDDSIRPAGAPDGHAALARLRIHACRDVSIAKPVDQPVQERQVHATDQLAMVVDERTKRAVVETDLARRLAWFEAAVGQRLDQRRRSVRRQFPNEPRRRGPSAGSHHRRVVRLDVHHAGLERYVALMDAMNRSIEVLRFDGGRLAHPRARSECLEPNGSPGLASKNADDPDHDQLDDRPADERDDGGDIKN